MSVETQHLCLPTIRVQSASPVPFEQPRITALKNAFSRAKGLKHTSPTSTPSTDSTCRNSPRKRTSSKAGLEEPKEDTKMTAKMTRHGSESSNSSRSSASSSSSGSSTGSLPSKKQATSPSVKRSKSISKDVDWTDVTDPEERRRIQNRIAQRKFREKARENKEKAERELRNQEHAGNIYRIATPTDLSFGAGATGDPELSGLPWGSVNWNLFVSRGHEVQSRRSSARGTYVGDDPYSAPHYVTYGNGLDQAASHGSSGGEEVLYEDTNYVYAPVSMPAYTAAAVGR